jgi:tRNA (mo5U34)-methyltransferase
MALSKEQKKEMIQAVKYWYHTIDLGEGLITPGWETIRSMNQTMIDFLPQSFNGMTILDIGCWDGLFSFEAEKRGAGRVLGIDNLGGGDGFSQDTLESIKGEGFKPLITAKTILGSKAEYQMMNVYDISPEKIGEFDCTIFFGVLYHLWHPMLALQLIKRVTKKCLFIETHVNEAIDQSQPLIRFYPRDEKYEGSTWVGLNLLALYEMLLVVGFKKVKLYRFRDYDERAMGMAFVEERHFEDFQFKHDERFIPFNPEKPRRGGLQ